MATYAVRVRCQSFELQHAVSATSRGRATMRN